MTASDGLQKIGSAKAPSAVNQPAAGRPGTAWQWLGDFLYERLGLQGITYSVPRYANSLPYVLGGYHTHRLRHPDHHRHLHGPVLPPAPSRAHQSVVFLITGVPLGHLVRSVHFWTAQIVTVTVILHLLRILYTAAYKRPREINWYVGLTLLAVTFGLVFTGSMLKFDQEGLEALQHNREAAELIGGLGSWFTPDFSRSVPLLTRLFNNTSLSCPCCSGC